MEWWCAHIDKLNRHAVHVAYIWYKYLFCPKSGRLLRENLLTGFGLLHRVIEKSSLKTNTRAIASSCQVNYCCDCNAEELGFDYNRTSLKTQQWMTVFIQLTTYGSLKAYEMAATIKRKAFYTRGWLPGFVVKRHWSRTFLVHTGRLKTVFW